MLGQPFAATSSMPRQCQQRVSRHQPRSPNSTSCGAPGPASRRLCLRRRLLRPWCCGGPPADGLGLFALVGQLQVPPVPGGGPPPAHRGRSQPHPLPHEGVGPGCRACQEQVLVSVWFCFGQLHGAQEGRHGSRRVQNSGCCCCRCATATAVLQHATPNPSSRTHRTTIISLSSTRQL